MALSCPPGYYAPPGASDCRLFQPYDPKTHVPEPEASDYFFRPKVRLSTYSTDTNAQTIFFVVTIILMILWLIPPLFVLRYLPLDDGRSFGFRLRYWLTRLDRRYARRHWLEEQKVQVKRRTELGGTCSVVSLIFFFGIGAGLVYDYAVNGNVTQQQVVPAQGKDVRSFANNLEFNITAVSGMRCSQWRYVGAQVGISGLQGEQRDFNNDLVTIQCADTPEGPRMNVECPSCQPYYDNYYVTWEFVDEPGLPAAAVGFDFYVTARGRDKHNKLSKQRSVTYGQVKAGSNGTFAPDATLRGNQSSILHFRLLPHRFKEHNNLKQMQVTFHQFTSGSYSTSMADLATALASPSGGRVRVTMRVEILSSYIAETHTNSNLDQGPLTFLAKIGGVYIISITVFALIQLQMELHMYFFRHEYKMINKLHNKRTARKRWHKLRVYVLYGFRWHRMEDELLLSMRSSIDPPGKENVMSLPVAALDGGSLNGDSKKAHTADDSTKDGLRKRSIARSSFGSTLESSEGAPTSERIQLLAQPKALGAGLKHEDRTTLQKMFRHVNKHSGREGVWAKDLPYEEDMKVPGVGPTATGDPAPAATPVYKQMVLLEPKRRGFDRAVSSIGNTVISPITALKAASLNIRPNLPHVHFHGRTPHVIVPSIQTPDEIEADKVGEDGKRAPFKRKRLNQKVWGSASSHKGSLVRQNRLPSWIPHKDPLPRVPEMEIPVDGEEEIDDTPPDKLAMYNYCVDLYDYNRRFRDDFLRAESMLENVIQRFRPHSDL